MEVSKVLSMISFESHWLFVSVKIKLIYEEKNS